LTEKTLNESSLNYRSCVKLSIAITSIKV